MKKVLLLLGLVLPVCLNAQLKINEIMSNNVSAVMDDAKNYSMWVELYNPSTTLARNQSSYYFTDDLALPKKWRPLSKSILPGKFSVLWFERDERAGHSSFKLNPEGGKLYLMDVNSKVVDSVAYPKQYRNISYGRQTDGGDAWVFFEQFSPNTTNSDKLWSWSRCNKPAFSVPGGYYTKSVSLEFAVPTEGDTIYYSINGSEPTRKSTLYVPGTPIYIGMGSIRVIRAKTFSKDKLSSDIASATYFINTRKHYLPVISVATTPANLTDNSMGIYVAGSYTNYNQPWDRPANFELFDSARVSCLNQEVDIATAGAYSRTFALKSLKIRPRSKFGDSRLRYDFFPSSKPNRKYRDILLRNSGNDYFNSMMRDGFMQTLVMNRMDQDLLAYQPAVFYLNSSYYGILNIREVTSEDYFYSNYGLNDDQVDLLETAAISTDTKIKALRDYVTNNDLTQPLVYEKVCSMLDVDAYMNHFLSQIYFGNTDWPWNNFKMWRKKDGGKWRCLMYDTDFGFNMYADTLYKHNTLTFALGENPVSYGPAEWSTLYFRKLMQNKTFRDQFIDRFSIQLSSTFETNRVNAIMDSLASKISVEIIYHKNRWGNSAISLVDDLKRMKKFAANRPDAMMGFIANRLADSARVQTVHIYSDTPGASYTMNGERIMDPEINLKYFEGREMNVRARPVFGYSFLKWEVQTKTTLDLIKMGDSWKYSDGNAMPAKDWFATTYNDSTWKSGPAQFGYGGKGEETILSYGPNASAKYPTAYFRKTFEIEDPAYVDNLSLTAYLDDGAAIYINGTEIGRYLLAAGTLTFSTYTTSSNNGDLVSFNVPKSLLRKGGNLIAVELHQSSAASTDMIFDLKMSCDLSAAVDTVTDPVYSTVLSNNMGLKAIYESSTMEIPDEDATILINELVSDNDSNMDEYGGNDDYIEMLNTGDKDVNIAGWYLTDTPENRTLFQIPTSQLENTLIPAHGRMVLWADNEPLQGIRHLGMKLGKDGETVLLSRKNLSGDIVTVDSVDCPALKVDHSYSRIPDGGPDWFIERPTFNSKNPDIVAVEKTRETKTTIDLYPTLVSESITVCRAAGQILTLADLSGKVMFRSLCESDQETLSVGFLPKGMYLITIGNQRFKIIKR